MKALLLQSLAGTTVLVGAIAAALGAPTTAPANPLRVSLYAANGAVEVIVTNTSNKVARVPKWQLPQSELQADLFRVSRDGQPVQYEGRMAKRGLPQPSDFAILRPGQSYRSTVDLSNAYDMRQAGQYTVTLASPLQFASLSDGRMLRTARGLPMLLQSAPVQLWSNGGHDTLAQLKAHKGKPGSGGSVVDGVTFKGCSSTQISGAGAAVVQARSYSQNAKDYLATGTVGARYTTWFGSYTSARYSLAGDHFQSIDAAMDQSGGQVTINCGCNQNYYAYVYPTKPYEIFVCKAFWSAPLAGTDSRGGTLIHEMSHFNVTAGTDDHVYGQSAAKSLAISDPDAALDNADNHEYIAENNPKLN
jgi:peptidyl-Lys metalloendopeptidase